LLILIISIYFSWMMHGKRINLLCCALIDI
jgi:hypothetical protein